MIKILDCTTRDGGHTTNWNFEDKFVFDLMDTLNKKGVQYYEIGYRNHTDTNGKGEFYTCKPEFIKKFYDKKGNLKLGIMADEKRFDEKDFPSAEKDYVDFVRVACHPDRILGAIKAVNYLIAKGYKVFLQIMDISNTDENGYINLYNFDKKNEIISLYIADSYGTLAPNDIEDYMKKLKVIGYEKISFHGHNSNGNVLKNSLKAVKCGAYSIDTTFNSAGRYGGNLDLNELIKSLN